MATEPHAAVSQEAVSQPAASQEAVPREGGLRTVESQPDAPGPAAPSTPVLDTAAAYRHCEEITRSQARNFFYGIRLLPPPKRRALSAVYAFARRIDDIGDGQLPAAAKLALLEQAAGAAANPAAHPGDPVLVALADAAARYPIPLGAFGELIEGCAADVRGETYETFDDLLYYCRCVAGSIGRLSLGVFGAADPGAAEPLADALGVALQLTNILRDIKEDHARGRVYLPSADIARFGCDLSPGPPSPDVDPWRLEDLVRYEARRAQAWYAAGLRLLPMLDRRSAACTAAMAGIYRRLLQRIAAAPSAAVSGRMSLPAWEKAWVAARALAPSRRAGTHGPRAGTHGPPAGTQHVRAGAQRGAAADRSRPDPASGGVA